MRLLKQAALAAALFLAIALFGAIITTPVFAQDTVAVTVTEPTLVQQVVTALLGLVGIIVTALVTWVANIIRQRFNIEIEAKHRDALQSALTNGILWAIQKAGWTTGDAVTPNILAQARSYVEASVPGALTHFGIDAATGIGKATLDRLLTPHLPLPAGTVMPNGDTLIGRAP